MTRYKEYLRTKGFKLENDFECLPLYDSGLEGVKPEVMIHGLAVTYYYTSVSHTVYIDCHGNETQGSYHEI